MTWSPPGSSTYRAPGIVRARYRAFSTWQTWSSTEWRISVGTRIAGATSRTSMSCAIRMNTSAAEGEADCILSLANHSSARGSSPQLRTKTFSDDGTLLQRSGSPTIDSSNSARVLSPQGQSSVVSSLTSAPQSSNATVRCGKLAAKSIDIGPPSDSPISAARSEPTASITARTSSILSSSVPAWTRSERPMPRLSNRITRAKEPRRSTKRRYEGSSQTTCRLVTKPSTKTMSTGPSPTTW